MNIIGISGRIGAGKSVTANFLAQKANGLNLEVDEIGHKLLNDNDIKNSLIKEFGTEITDESGLINRKKLGKKAFKNKENINKLNSIMHPVMVKKVKQIINNPKNNCYNFILINAALLFTMHLNELCQHIIYIDADPEIRLNRLMQYRKMSKDKAIPRLFAQDVKPNIQNISVINNNSTLEKLFDTALKELSNIINKLNKQR